MMRGAVVCPLGDGARAPAFLRAGADCGRWGWRLGGGGLFCFVQAGYAGFPV